MFIDRLNTLISEKGITRVQLLNDLNLGKNQIRYWEKNNVEPNAVTLNAIANYFSVSVDYLLGKTDKKEKPASLKDELKGVNFALYGEVHDLTEDEMQDVLNYVKYMKSKRGK